MVIGLNMRAKRGQSLTIREVRFSPANDEVSRRKISEVYKLLLSIRKGKERVGPEADGRDKNAEGR